MKKKYNVIVFSVCFSLLCAIIVIYCYGKKINIILKRYVNFEVERFTINVINNSIDDSIINDVDDSLYKIEKNTNNEVNYIDFDTKNVNKILKKIDNKIKKDLKEIENGNINDMDFSDSFLSKRFSKTKKGIICEVSLGSLVGNSFFSNVGTIIPVKIVYIGGVLTNLNTEVKSYGINNLFFEMDAHIEIKARIVMPLFTDEVTISNDVPLISKIINGSIPNYYQNGFSNSSNQNISSIE